MKKILLYGIVALIGVLQSCKEDFVGQVPTDSVAPGQISDVQIKKIPGGAEFTYTLPKDEDLLYVEAQYEMKGSVRNVKASCFEDKLVIEGYADMDEHEVKLYCVDRSNNYSQPVVMKFKPEENPVTIIGAGLTMARDIGGVHVQWANETRTPVNVLLYAADKLGQLQLAEVLYTSVAVGDYYLRGFDDQERRFAVLVKDRWDNYSDTVSGYFTPRFEEIVPKKDIKRYLLTEDNNSNMGGTWDFYKMFDDVTTGDTGGWHTTDLGGASADHGIYFTVDLGHLVQLTRIKVWQRGGGYYYTHHNPKKWEIYTRAEDPKLLYDNAGYFEDNKEYWGKGFRTDSDNWYHLMSCKAEKPSGFESSIITPEDREYAVGGHEFIVDESAPAVRYVRFTIDETWGGGNRPTNLHIAELGFWGKILDEK